MMWEISFGNNYSDNRRRGDKLDVDDVASEVSASTSHGSLPAILNVQTPVKVILKEKHVPLHQ